MAAFNYIAIDAKGEKIKGVIEAENLKQSRQFLRERGLTPLDVQAVSTKMRTQSKRGSKKSLFKQSISSKELALMTRQFATLLAAGMPAEEVLAAVGEQTEKPKTKALILSVRGKVLEGHSLAHAMRDFPRAFSPLYCSTVAAGERSGHLDKVLERLADYTEQQANMRQKIQNALIYPSIMILVAFGIVGFLLEYVVPKMIAVYSNINQTLPILTQILIAISNGMQTFGLYLLLALVVVGFLFFRSLKSSKTFREKFHLFLLRTPVIGNAIKVANTARFSRTFAILSSAGVPVLEAMTISSQLITNIPIHDAVTSAISRIREGANINLALKQTQYFPPMSVHLIASGEASGQLEAMLERAATNQENDISQLIETTLTLLEPVIILLMGAIVLFIVLAVLLPIFQLDQFTG